MSFAIQLLGSDWCHDNNLSQLGNAGAAAAVAAVAVAGDGVAGGGVVAGDDDDDWRTPVHEPAAAAVAVAAGVVVAAADVEGYVQVDLFFFHTSRPYTWTEAVDFSIGRESPYLLNHR